MDQNEETLLQSPSPPQKRPRLDMPWDDEDAKTLEEERKWFESIRQQHLLLSIYENAMNGLIEQSGVRNAIEDEAVSMAIRSHGLTCYNEGFMDFPMASNSQSSEWFCQIKETGEKSLSSPAAYAFGPCSSTSRDDILSQAVSAAIKKKGLGAVDR